MPSSPRAEVPFVPPTMQQEIARLAGSPEIRAAFAWLRAEEAQFAAWQLEMARIPAPPFGETARGEWLRERFRALELEDVCTDEVGNVFGIHQDHAKLTKPSAAEQYIALSAHIDTVFPAGTPLNRVSRATASTGPAFLITEPEPRPCWRWQPRCAHPK